MEQNTSVPATAAEKAIDAYGNTIFKKLGTIIKAIAFIIAFIVFAMFLALAFILYMKDIFFIALAVGVAVLGLLISTIILFLIYALGHIVCQNNEILARLRRMDQQ